MRLKPMMQGFRLGSIPLSGEMVSRNGDFGTRHRGWPRRRHPPRCGGRETVAPGNTDHFAAAPAMEEMSNCSLGARILLRLQPTSGPEAGKPQMECKVLIKPHGKPKKVRPPQLPLRGPEG